jgi:hypothetical protein
MFATAPGLAGIESEHPAIISVRRLKNSEAASAQILGQRVPDDNIVVDKENDERQAVINFPPFVFRRSPARQERLRFSRGRMVLAGWVPPTLDHRNNPK